MQVNHGKNGRPGYAGHIRQPHAHQGGQTVLRKSHSVLQNQFHDRVEITQCVQPDTLVRRPEYP